MHGSSFDSSGVRGGVGECDRDPDDEQEKGKNEVGRSEPVPRGVAQRRVDGTPGARGIDDYHGRDGVSTQRVKGEQAGRTIH